jgi:hypothetical protein
VLLHDIVEAKPVEARMPFEVANNVRCDGTGYLYPGGADAYERELLAIASNIRGTNTGRTLLGFFALRQRQVTIRPLGGVDPYGTDQSSPASGKAHSDLGAHPTDAFWRNVQPRDIQGRVVPGVARGTGRGVDTTISFTPLVFSQDPETQADAVLVHELFHSMRSAFGMSERQPLGPDFRNAEEMYSIFVENMHRVERGYGLRSSHRRQQMSIDPSSGGSHHRMADNPLFHEPMRRISGMMPTIVNALARIDISYNPFRDWLDYVRSHPNAGLRPHPSAAN